MSPAEIERTVRDVMETVDQSSPMLPEHKACIRYAIVDPILWALGWSTWLPWACRPDSDLGQRSWVDYAIFDSNGDIAVFGKSMMPGCVAAPAPRCGNPSAGCSKEWASLLTDSTGRSMT